MMIRPTEEVRAQLNIVACEKYLCSCSCMWYVCIKEKVKHLGVKWCLELFGGRSKYRNRSKVLWELVYSMKIWEVCIFIFQNVCNGSYSKRRRLLNGTYVCVTVLAVLIPAEYWLAWVKKVKVSLCCCCSELSLAVDGVEMCVVVSCWVCPTTSSGKWFVERSSWSAGTCERRRGLNTKLSSRSEPRSDISPHLTVPTLPIILARRNTEASYCCYVSQQTHYCSHNCFRASLGMRLLRILSLFGSVEWCCTGRMFLLQLTTT